MNSYDTSVQSVAGASTKMNSSPLFRMLLGFMSPVFGLFDDYWFYIYHQNTWDNFFIFPDLLVIMYTVNQERILPDYLRFADRITIDQFCQSKYFENYTHERIMKIDDQMVYIAENFQEIILRQFPFIVVGLILIKLITVLIRKTCLKNLGSNVKKRVQSIGGNF